jgi:phosphodiesterase/alkaline phosphatase D-like protein
VGIRFRNAAQAYMEWLPIRRGPGSMGVINTTSITQIIEWGNLASVVAFDTRLSFRSKEPTLRESTYRECAAWLVRGTMNKSLVLQAI